MKHATITGNTASPVTGTHYTDASGVQHDLRAIRGWSREDKAQIGLYEVERQDVTEGHEATGWTLEPGEGVVLEVPTLREVTPEEAAAALQAQFQAAIEDHVEQIARTRQYSSAVSLASYVASTNEGWAAEAQAFVAWRDAVWAYALAELAKVQAGDREVPELSAFIAELPPIEWP